jgi:hypothetical protein
VLHAGTVFHDMEVYSIHPVWVKWGNLEEHVVRVRLRSGVVAVGRLCAIDPDSGSAALLSEPRGDSFVALGHVIESIEAFGERAVPDTFSGCVSPSPPAEEHLRDRLGTTSRPKSVRRSDLDPLALVYSLKQMRFNAVPETDGDGSIRAIDLLHGTARILRPFRPEDCESTNEMVLCRIQALVRQLDSRVYVTLRGDVPSE